MKTTIIGILNITPDSFSDGGRYVEAEAAGTYALQMQAQGADLIDVGAVSTRPSAAPVREDEELRRLAPMLDHLCQLVDPNMLSVDAHSTAAAQLALARGVRILNLYGGFMADSELPRLLATQGGRAIIYPSHLSCHAQPAMIGREKFFVEQITLAEKAGLRREQLILDPGMGLGLGYAGCLELLRNFYLFTRFSCPLAIGVSRKQHLAKLGGAEYAERDSEMRVEAGLAAAAIAVERGATYVRTHDVRATKQFFTAFDTLRAARLTL